MIFLINNVGTVQSAEIEIAPMTFFFGARETGKKIVASLIWSTLSEISKLESELLNQKFNQAFNSTSEITEISIEADEIVSIQDSASQHISNNQIEIISRALHLESHNFANSTLQLSFIKEIKKITFSLSKISKKIDITNNADTIDKSITERLFYTVSWNIEKYGGDNISVNWGEVEFDIVQSRKLCVYFQKIIKNYILFKKNYSDIVFAPTARSGILINKNLLAKSLAKKLNAANKNQSNLLNESLDNNFFADDCLTQALASYTYKVVNDDFVLQNNNPIAQELNKLMGGELCYETINNQKKLMFKMNNQVQSIPLSNASSIVTAISGILPLINNNPTYLIYEEPESQLDLETERKMARILARYVNNDNYLLATSYSETFLQQINNLIMLNRIYQNNPNVLDDFSINKNELIDFRNIIAYEFFEGSRSESGSTIIKKIIPDEYGISIESTLLAWEEIMNENIEILEHLKSTLNK